MIADRVGSGFADDAANVTFVWVQQFDGRDAWKAAGGPWLFFDSVNQAWVISEDLGTESATILYFRTANDPNPDGAYEPGISLPPGGSIVAVEEEASEPVATGPTEGPYGDLQTKCE